MKLNFVKKKDYLNQDSRSSIMRKLIKYEFTKKKFKKKYICQNTRIKQMSFILPMYL